MSAARPSRGPRTVSDDDARVARRLAPSWSVDVWTGACVRVVAAATREEKGASIATPAHFLAAAWAPAARGPSRFPETVVIGSPDPTRALDDLLRHLPQDAKLYLASLDDVDVALAADILLACDRNLEPYQAAGVAAFAHAERERIRRVVGQHYTDVDAGFERFRARLLSADR